MHLEPKHESEAETPAPASPAHAAPAGPAGPASSGQHDVTGVIATETKVEVKEDAGLTSALNEDFSQFRQTVRSLVSTFSSRKPQDLSPEQENNLYEQLLGRYIALYQTLGQDANKKYSGMANIGIHALRSGKIVMAATIYDIISYNTSTSAALVAVMRGVWKFAIFFTMFCAVVFFLLYILPIYLNFSDNATLVAIRSSIRDETGKVVLAAIAGCFGGIVSLLLRLSEFETMQRRSREFMELTGATLPLVGGISASVVGAIFSADIININAGTAPEADGVNPWLYLVIGFLSGFSERFTRSVLKVAENRFGGSGDNQQKQQSIAIDKKELEFKVENTDTAKTEVR